jgi:hypothetical protein
MPVVALPSRTPRKAPKAISENREAVGGFRERLRKRNEKSYPPCDGSSRFSFRDRRSKLPSSLGLSQSPRRLEQQQRLPHGGYVVDAEDLNALPGQGQRGSDRAGQPVGVGTAEELADEPLA